MRRLGRRSHDRHRIQPSDRPDGAQPAGRRRARLDGLCSFAEIRLLSADRRTGRTGLEYVERLHPDRRADVHHDGRADAPLRHERAPVQRPGAVVRANSGTPDPHQHRRQRHLRRHLGILGGDRGDHRHRRDPQHGEGRLQPAAVSRLDRRRRHARHPDPAVDQHDHLCGADRHLGRPALRRGVHSRLHAGRAVLADRVRRSDLAAESGGPHGRYRRTVATTDGRTEASGAAARPVPHRGRDRSTSASPPRPRRRRSD